MDEIRTEMIVQRAGMDANSRFWDENVLRKAFEEANERLEDVSFVGDQVHPESISDDGFTDFFRKALEKSIEESYAVPASLFEESLNIEEFANCLTMINRRRLGNIRSLQEEFDKNMENLYKHFIEFNPDNAKRIKELLMEKPKHLC